MATAGHSPLCLQPMTHGDARYAEGRDTGRRDGLAEAANHLECLARAKAGAPLASTGGILRDLYRVIADEIRAKAGEP